MTDEQRTPRPGETFFDDDNGESEIAEVAGVEDAEASTWKVVDEDGEEAIIKWSDSNERWEVDA